MGSNGVSIHWPSMTKNQILASPGKRIVELFRSWHKARGWQDIGYHFVLNRDESGKTRVYPGRYIYSAGAHSGTAYGNSFIGINVAYGTDEEIPEEMFDALARHIAALSDKYNFEISDKTVKPHKYFVPTDCPGKSLLNRWPELIKRSASYTAKNPKAKVAPPPRPPESLGKVKGELFGKPATLLRIDSQSFVPTSLLAAAGFKVEYIKALDTVKIDYPPSKPVEGDA